MCGCGRWTASGSKSAAPRFEPDRRAFESTVARLFDEPEALVWGEETTRAAADRFSRAVHVAIDSCGDATAALVTHGTVISLFVARHNAIDPLALWQQLGLPSFVVLELPSCGLIEIVASMEDDSKGSPRRSVPV